MSQLVDPSQVHDPSDDPTVVIHSVLLADEATVEASAFSTDDATVEISALAAAATGAIDAKRALNATGTEVADEQPRKRLRAAIFWSYALTAGKLGTTTIVTFLLAHMLGPQAFGVVAQALLFVMIGQMLLQQTLLTTIIQREELDDDHLDAGFWLVLGGSIVLAAIFAVGAPLWAAFNNLPQLTWICVALSPLVILQALTVVPEAVLRRRMTFRSLTYRTLIASVVGGVAGVVLALMGFQAWALVGQQLVTGVVGAVVLWTVTDWRPKMRVSKQAFKDLWGFSSTSAVGGIGVFISLRLDVLVLGKWFGPFAVGLYRIAQRLPDMLVEVTVRSLQQVSLPELARLQRDREELAHRLGKMLHAAAVVGLPALGILAADSKPLVALLGPQWAAAGPGMQLLCIVGAVNVYGLLLGPTLQAVGRPGLNSAFAWIQVAFGTFCFYLAHRALAGSADNNGQVAVIALTMAGIEFVVTVIMAYVTLRRILKVRIWTVFGPTWPALLAGILSWGAVMLLDSTNPHTTWLVKFVLYGTLATVVAGVILLLLDRRLAGMVLRKVGPTLKRLRAKPD
jgi:PST family polysaccharide transporter